MDKQPPPTYDWKIRAKDPKRDVPNVKAAYFADSIHDGFIAFKDSSHKIIYQIARDEVLDIGRIDPTTTPTAIIKVSGNPTEAEIASIKARILNR